MADDHPILTDDEIKRIIDRFIAAGRIAERCGAEFVDVKHCHGYLGHEFLSAVTRPGPYGGSFENRTRFLREVVAGIRAATARLKIGVRLSAFDFVPFRPDPNHSGGKKLGVGVPDDFAGALPYRHGFGADANNPVEYDLTDTVRFIELLERLDIRMLNVTAGSPYYNPHVLRPALFPPSDGYQPPEDPLVGCARHIQAAAELKKRFPNMILVGTGYTYFRNFCRMSPSGRCGRGRWTPSAWAGWSWPALLSPLTCCVQESCVRSVFAARSATAPRDRRNGLVSGCYPLDPF